MSQVIQGLMIALSFTIGLAGCNTVSDKLAEPAPSGGEIAKRETRIDRDAPRGNSCELKNPSGTGKCEDGRRATAEQLKTTYISYGPCRVMKQFKSETDDEWKKRDPEGSQCVASENTRIRAELQERIDKLKAIGAWIEKNERLERERKEAASRLSVTRNAAPSTDRSGTWYCDTVDGSGAYGTFEMTRHPRFVNCKKVN
jgi:hypothetical protein